VLTNSDGLRDVTLAYQLGANSFLVKPLDFEQFVAVLHTLQGYWLWVNRAPEISRPNKPQRKARDGGRSVS